MAVDEADCNFQAEDGLTEHKTSTSGVHFFLLWLKPTRLTSRPVSIHFKCVLRVFVFRCLGRESTASYFPAARTAAPGFARRRNTHQLQQPSPKDHRRRFPALLPSAENSVSDVARPVPHGAAATGTGGRLTVDLSEATPRTFDFRASSQTHGPLTGKVVRAGASTAVHAGGAQDGVVAENHLSAVTLAVTGLVIKCDPAGACAGLGPLRRLRPRRECGRGRR